MSILRISAGLILAMASVFLQAQTPTQEISVTGKLVRMMAIGAESTGWAIDLDSATTINGQQVHSLQVIYRKTKRLEKLKDKHVSATGKLSHRHGVETGAQPVLEISSIQEVPGQQAQAPATIILLGSEWQLEDLGGLGKIEHSQATLAFSDSGRVSGNGSCNRFNGAAEITGDAIKLGPLVATRMACPEDVMNQQAKYLKALDEAERFEWKDPYLLIYSKGLDKPLRFTRVSG